MKTICHPLTTPAILGFSVVVFLLAAPINLSVSRTLDETLATEDPTVKCAPCIQSPPPPSPSPPPPELYLSPPPPPSPNQPPTSSCPPPPSTLDNSIYVIGPPGSVYSIDPDYSNGVLRLVVISLPVMVWCGLVVIVGFC